MVTLFHTLLTPAFSSGAAPDGLRGGIQRYRARTVDSQRLVPILEMSGEVTIANIVGVVKDKVFYKPLEPADDNSDPKDPEEATGLNDAVCLIFYLFLYFVTVFEISLLMYL